MEFNEINLNEEEYKGLQSILKADGIPDEDMGKEPYRMLLAYGLIEHDYRDKFPYEYPAGTITLPRNALVITNKGRSMLEKMRRKNESEKKNDRRYRITTAIAILALVIAILSLLSQLQILTLPTVQSLP